MDTSSFSSPSSSSSYAVSMSSSSSYEEETIDNTRMSQKSGRSGQGETDSPTMVRAKELQSKLPPEFPSFVKQMFRSHVTIGFWLSLPKKFCDSYLPKKDETIFLVDEHELAYDTKYLIQNKGLSGGWRFFAVSHKLVEGDVVIFQLLKSLTFKVFIIRLNLTSELDGASGLLNLHPQARTLDNIAYSEDELEDVKNVEMISGDKSLESDETEIRQENGICNTDEPYSGPSAALRETEYGNDELESEEMEGVRLAEFRNATDFDSFRILADGLVIGTKIPRDLQYKYYELCRSQNSFLHDRFVKGINCMLAAGIIYETVIIADKIKAARLGVSLDQLQSWDKMLMGFEYMGMKVEFLRTCLHDLMYFWFEQRDIIRSKKEKQAQVEKEIRDLKRLLFKQKEIIKSKKLEQTRLENEKRDLKSKISQHSEVKEALEAEIEGEMGQDLSDLEVAFKNKASAAW